MLPENSLDESFKKMIKDYITENLSISIALETDDNGNPHAVEVSLLLEGDEFDIYREWF